MVEGHPEIGTTALLLTLAGRMKLAHRAGPRSPVWFLPEQAASSAARDRYLDCAADQRLDLRRDLRGPRSRAGPRSSSSITPTLWTHDDRAALASLLDDLGVQAHEQSVVLAVRHRASIADLVPGPFSSVTLGRSDDLIGAPTRLNTKNPRHLQNKETDHVCAGTSDHHPPGGSVDDPRSDPGAVGGGRRLLVGQLELRRPARPGAGRDRQQRRSGQARTGNSCPSAGNSPEGWSPARTIPTSAG